VNVLLREKSLSAPTYAVHIRSRFDVRVVRGEIGRGPTTSLPETINRSHHAPGAQPLMCYRPSLKRVNSGSQPKSTARPLTPQSDLNSDIAECQPRAKLSRPECTHWGRFSLPATPIRFRHRDIVKSTSKCSQSISSVRRPIVEWRLDPILQIFTPLPTIRPQRFNTSFASIAIDPGAPEHAPDDVDAVEDVALRDNRRFNSQRTG
jgi:hypothetical protein